MMPVAQETIIKMNGSFIKATVMIKILFILLSFLQPEDPWIGEIREIASSMEKAESIVSENITWTTKFERQLEVLDENIPGNIGVYIKNLNDGHELNYNGSDYWYLSSAIKIPLAVAVLQKAEDGTISLDDELVLSETDFVDGAGDLAFQNPGTRYSIAELIDKMVRNSDSSATDMLMRLIGEEEFNEQIRNRMVPEGFNPITTILQVRYDAYSEVHEKVLELSNLDIIQVNRIRSRPGRLAKLRELMAVDENELKVRSIEEAFERYYRRNLNSATMESVGMLLERLYNGELLSQEHTEFLLDIMQGITTGDRRIKAGLPTGFRFAQKTGTQIESAANIGLIFPDNYDKPLIISVCITNFGDLREAEKAFQTIGRLIAFTIL